MGKRMFGVRFKGTGNFDQVIRKTSLRNYHLMWHLSDESRNRATSILGKELCDVLKDWEKTNAART